MAHLSETLREAMRWYVGDTYGGNCRIFMLDDEDSAMIALVIVDYPQRRIPAEVFMLAGVVEERIVIYRDNASKPLIQRLERHGVPTSQIIYAEQGEQRPDVAHLPT